MLEVLRVEKLGKSFGKLVILRDVSFSVLKGEGRVVIIGPNGAGKTTLFNMITGELEVTAGKIYLFSQDVTAMPTYRRARLGISRTFQIVNLFRSANVIENVLLALKANNKCKYQIFRPMGSYTNLYENAKGLLERMKLWDKRYFNIGGLSHGEMRKLELTLGFAMDPKLVLLDEPTAGLTMSESEQLAAIIRGLSQDVNLIMIEHDMKIAFELADRIIVLSQGGILADGKPDDIRKNQRVNEVYLGKKK